MTMKTTNINEFCYKKIGIYPTTVGKIEAWVLRNCSNVKLNAKFLVAHSKFKNVTPGKFEINKELVKRGFELCYLVDNFKMIGII